MGECDGRQKEEGCEIEGQDVKGQVIEGQGQGDKDQDESEDHESENREGEGEGRDEGEQGESQIRHTCSWTQGVAVPRNQIKDRLSKIQGSRQYGAEQSHEGGAPEGRHDSCQDKNRNGVAT